MSRIATTHISRPLGKTTTALGQHAWLHSATSAEVDTPMGVRPGVESVNELTAKADTRSSSSRAEWKPKLAMSAGWRRSPSPSAAPR
jgi:hypothetical protein